ncbi:hypothetical protein C2G38_979498 [Gigaspora rosea]|uniref:G-protein coupled receptors family 1 profile domain-containing protein n=1 Tax=Gigaspora rosea TaxID=44941 RepID=A0A397VU86_9GLOM|nr:hypothetical protein C2G38_979498 [Gigaspora rosea]
MGRYDYRFFLIIVLISIMISLVGINDYGPSRFWCYNSPSNPITPLITIALVFLILFITLFCYIMTLLEVNIQQSTIKKLDSNSSPFSRIDLLVVRKIIAYILIFLIEWTPTVIYLITSIFQYENIWIYTGSVIFINLGGIGNAILYISYEGWTNRYGESNIGSTNASSGYSESNQESYPQIKIHDVEKENLTSGSLTLNLPDQEL